MGTFIGIVVVLILVLIFFVFLSWLSYLVLYLPTEWLVKANRRKNVRLIISPLTVILVLAIHFGTHRPSNDDTATIENIDDNYQITLTGQRLYMVHDPISLLMRETYSDSTILTIPRPNGIITGQEIQRESDYEILGTIKINNDKMNVDLYYKNTEPTSWNGDYKLKWKTDH